ncbi:hypothetical protein APHAL10511_005925 [Amanita phalloides]|nr:hypothetical protein APHAL10511_005925 [Amanita phalloides]
MPKPPLPDQNARPLNVTDALSYLDAVKVQFHDRPEVYNHFLDIMKDFKSQIIDTPGVIQRVSRLFHGNPNLIQGFNTFLPVGYRIDISSDPLDLNTITVTTPAGITTQSINNPFGTQRSSLPFGIGGGTLSRSLTPHGLHLNAGSPFDPSAFPSTQTTAAASFLGNLNGRDQVGKQAAGEFNHAIQYLNKIKARYADDNNTYKQFLDILQTYQKEQRDIQDVYLQVQLLFKDAPELLAEFRDFLPEVASLVPSQNGVVILPQPGSQLGPTSGWNQQDVPVSGSSLAKKTVATAKRRKRLTEKDSTPAPSDKLTQNRNKRIKYQQKPAPDSPSFSPYADAHSPQLAQAHSQHSTIQHTTQMTVAHSQHALITHTGHHMGTPADKLLFFDRAKRSLEPGVYEEFLKLLSLFSKDIISLKTLIERVKVFFEGDLMMEFKDLVGWDDRTESVEYGPPGSIRTGPPEALAAQPADDGEGPSYRKLPESEIRLACSGRDELCRSVLNDEWVSHPTWASEEAGFVAHKKNQFEEALHKSEEERHEYHVHLEALSRTIAVLEPLIARLEEMTGEERASFKLKPDFGGSSKSIYHRILKKIYGREGGTEVMQALQECPSVALPVVVARLRQKDEEWRRAQREWSRTWREVDSRNFYKSLDHQGISFKANDKKNITAKHFVADIETIKSEQLNEWEQSGRSYMTHGSVGFQLEYSFQDTSVLFDSLKMVYSFLDRSQAQYTQQERRAVEKFLRAFIPLLCMYPVTEFNAACGPLEGGGHDDDVMPVLDNADGLRSGGRRSVGSTISGNTYTGVAASDLRRKLFKTAQEKSASGRASVAGSRAVSPSDLHSPKQGDDVKCKDGNGSWIQESMRVLENGPPLEVDRPFFANTTFYALLRLLQLLYSRLLMCKEIGGQLAAQKHASLIANKVAVELGLDDPNGPSAILTQTMEVLGDRSASDGSNVVYLYLLNECEKLFDNELDQAAFEEHMRWFFGTKAYQLFTLDKLITALVKQVQTILSDNRCQELWSFLQSAQNIETITNQDVARYRRVAEKLVGPDDHLYRLQWVRGTKKIRVYLVGTEDTSADSDGSREGRWREYVNTYVSTYPTEWLPGPKDGRPKVFLKRTVWEEKGMMREKELRVRVDQEKYRIVYERGSEETMWRERGREERAGVEERVRRRVWEGLSRILALYEQDDDGRWRKVVDYTLYGSMVCGSCRGPTGVVMDDQLRPSPPPPPPFGPHFVPSARQTVDVTDSLPPGWNPNHTPKHTSLIIALSVILAVAICTLIIGCLLLKRARHVTKFKNVDLEMKLGKRKRIDGVDDESMDAAIAKEKARKATQVFWARATARWRANVRYAARQRRGKRGAVVRLPHALNSSLVSLPRQEESSSPATPPQQVQDTGSASTAETEGRPLERVPSPDLSGPSMPPAYQYSSHDSSTRSPETPALSSGPSLSLYHLATDDKVVLAQMVDLASAPPAEDSATTGVSAPAWPDEGEFLVEDEHCCDVGANPPIGSSSLLPPPPSKGKLALGYFDYHYSFDDIEPELGPSAPPFEEAIEPSAPPLSLDAPPQDASAPVWQDPSLPTQGPIDSNGRPPGYQPH